MIQKLLSESNEFYPHYMQEHSNSWNRVLHFIGASIFFILLFVAFIYKAYWLVFVAIFIGYLLPGLGHHFLQNNDSFRATKPILCVICAARMYFETLTLGIFSKK